MRRVALAAAVCTLCAAASLCGLPAAAGADVFGPIALASEGTLMGAGAPQQADYAHDAAISANGLYVAFDGSVGGVTGVWRRDLATGSIEQVAGGDAELPSISESGQYISFTSNEGAHLAAITDDRADPEHETHEAPNVYVRNMALPASQPCEAAEAAVGGCAFTLVSAVNGSTQALSYEYPSPPESEQGEFDAEHYGAMAAGRSAISADGRHVAFVTSAVSNLVADPARELEEIERGETPKLQAPAMQVAVRDLDTEETRLVSVRADPATGAPIANPDIVPGEEEPVPLRKEGSETYGAVYPGVIPAFGPPPTYGVYAGSTLRYGASISADGSTVAWMGVNVSEQARMMPDDAAESNAAYSEPLWRRIADGAGAPTRRVTGGSDPANPACVASGETSLPSPETLSDPCQGPFNASFTMGTWSPAGTTEGYSVPQLSSDGYTVAFLANARLVALGQGFNNEAEDGRPFDLYVADMHEGLSRAQALTPVTQLASGNLEDRATTAAIVDFGLSPDGRQVAFTTERTKFLLGAPAYLSAPAAEAGITELFDADLEDETLTRVTHGYAGPEVPGEHPHVKEATGFDPYPDGDGALSPSFSASGDELAFTSTASNLVYGDGNTPLVESNGFDGSDAFLVERASFSALPTPQYVSPPPPSPLTGPQWRLGATALSRADGSVLLYVEVPGSGKLSVSAQGAVVLSAAKAAAKKSSAGKSSAGKSRSGHAATARPHATVATRTVASAAQPAAASGGGLIIIKLVLSSHYRALASARGGFSALAKILFSAPGHATLRQSLGVVFVRTPPPAKAAHPARAARRRRKSSAHRR